MNDFPDMNKFGAAKWPNVMNFSGPRGSEGVRGMGSTSVNSPEVTDTYDFFLPKLRG